MTANARFQVGNNVAENLKSNNTNSKTLLPHKSKKTAFNFLTERRHAPPAMHF